MTTSPVDTITLPASGLNTPQVKFQISAELMKNSQKSSPIEPTENILVVQDSSGSPMIFSIGTDNVFHLIKHDSGTTDGWTVVNLSTQFADYATAKTFDISQDLKGNISITLALTKKDQNTTDVFVASMLSNDYNQTDWSKFRERCHQIIGFDSNFVAEEILMGTSDDGKTPLTVIAGNIRGSKFYYQILNGQTSDTLEFPENVSKNPGSLMGISIGSAFGQRGVFFLYNIGDTQTLETTTLADAELGSIHYDFSPGNDGIPEPFRNLTYTCMTTAIGTQTKPINISSDVYVGTETGVYVFANSRLGNMQKVTDKIQDVHEIIVRTDGDNISIWVMASPSNLYYIYGKRGKTYTFNDPIQFSDNIIHVAPIRSMTRKANELFLINQDQVLTQYWQDPNSTLWHQRTLNIKNESSLINFNSYTTHINLKDENGDVLINKNVKITCSEWLYATINGKIYSLDKDVPAQVSTDVLGNITIITAASDISAPIFHLETDFIDKTLNIYPNGKITRGLKTIQSGSDLKNAKTQDGEAVLTEQFSDNTLNGVAQNINQLNHAASQFTSDMGNNTYVALADKGAKHDGSLNTSFLATNFAVGMYTLNNEWSLTSNNNVNISAASISPSATGTGEVFHFLGDVLHEIENFFIKGIEKIEEGIAYLADGVSFVIKKIEQGLQFVLSIGEKVYNVILDSISSVSKVVNWIFQLVKVGIEEVVKWLGHLFGWDDIWHTHKVLAKIITSGLDYGVTRITNEADQWKKDVANTFDSLDNQLKQLVIPDNIRSENPKQQTKGDANSDHASLIQSPGGNWSFYHLQHSGLLMDSGESTGDNPFSQFFNDVVSPTTGAIYDSIKNDIEDFEKILSGSATIDDLYKLLSDLIDTIIEPIKKLIVGLIDFIKDLIKDIQRALEDDWDISLISDLYKWLTGVLGEEEKFTAINGISLLMAIPVTYIYKGIIGQAPFTDETSILNDSTLFSKVMGNTLSAPNAPLNLELFSMSEVGTRFESLTKTVSSQVGGLITSLADLFNDTSMLDLEVLAISGDGLAAPSMSGDGEPKDIKTLYSQLGGLIATVAEFFIITTDLIGIATEVNPNDGMINSLASPATKIGIVSAVIKSIFTFPIRKPTQTNDGYNLNIAAWSFSVINVIQGAVFRQKVSGGITIGADAIILVMAIIANAINKEEGWTWSTDILSNVSGIVTGVGVYAGPEVGVFGWGGAYFSCVIGLAATTSALASGENKILRLTNIGGL
jgi:hypothetical protein